MKINKIKNIYENIKIYFCIDKSIEELISVYLKKGRIVKLLSYDQCKFYTCPKNLPSEYCSKENFVIEMKVLTNKNEIFIIKEEYLGVNFESSCDKYVLKIFDENNNLIADTYDLDTYLQIERKKIINIKDEIKHKVLNLFKK